LHIIDYQIKKNEKIILVFNITVQLQICLPLKWKIKRIAHLLKYLLGIEE